MNNSFLSGINFKDGDYALYVKHKDFGEFLVTDEAVLKANKNNIIVSVSFLNFLPGRGDRSFGIELYKDKKPIKQKFGCLFKVFKIGDIAQYGQPVKKEHFEGTKHEILAKTDSLNNEEDIYFHSIPTFYKDGKEFILRIKIPSVAVPVKREIDSTGYEQTIITNHFEETKFIQELKECLIEKTDSITDYNLNIHSTEVANYLYLFDVSKNWNGYLRDSNNNLIEIKDYIFYKFQATFKATDTVAKQLSLIDFTDCLTEAQRLRPQVIENMKEKVLESTQPNLNVDNSEVGLSEYQDQWKISNIYEQEYGLSWFKIVE
jgi:hypothetical protein